MRRLAPEVVTKARYALAVLLWLTGLALFPSAAVAQDEAVIGSVEVTGNLRVEAEAILRQISLSPGDRLDARRLGDDIRSVYSLGYFDDIQVDAQMGEEGVILTFLVEEKPMVTEVRFDGNDHVSQEDLDEAVTVETGEILDETLVRRNETTIEDLYREKGYYLVEVESEVELDGATGAFVTYRIRESDRVQIGGVTVVGNTVYTDRELRGVMRTRPRDFVSWLTRTGTFDADDLAEDLQRIRVYYYDAGYLDIEVGDPLVELSRDRRRIYITIPLEEGAPYRISSVGVSGDLLVPVDEMMELVEMAPDTVFRASTVRGDIERITSFYRSRGYASANVNLLTDMDPEAHTIGVELDLQQGELAHVGRISFSGNTVTRDLVMRREMTIEEGDLYSSTQIERSEAYVRRLGFFEDVVIREEVDPEDSSYVNLVVEVTERPARSFQVGFGYSSAESFIGTAQISENNLFGRGQNVALNVTLSGVQSIFSLSFTEPRLFDSRWQLGTELYRRRVLYSEFTRDSSGGALSVGYRLTRDLSLSLGYGLEDVRVEPGGTSGQSRSRSRQLYQGGLTTSLTSSLTFDRRDDRMYATRGSSHTASLEVADSLLGGDNEFVRLRGATRWYWSPLWPGWVVKANVEAGFVGSTNPEQAVPIFERFYVGGPNSVRGFQRLSLSPTRPTARSNDPLSTTREFPYGGNRELVANLELEFPIFVALGLRGVVFVDAGNAFDTGQALNLNLDLFDPEGAETGSVLRTAAGMGIRWRSPIGPLRFEWGFPLQRLDSEPGMVFEFSIMDPF